MQYIYKFLICTICIIAINYFYSILLAQNTSQYLYIYDDNDRRHLDLLHFEALYPSSSSSWDEESEIKKQKAIGICVNFNNDPDNDGNTLGSILPFYTTINQYVAILTPSAFEKFSGRNRQLFDQFNTIPILTEHHNFSFVNDRLNTTSTVYHIECNDARAGQLQQRCLLLCAQFYARLKSQYSSLRGILYIADDLYFNFDYVFSHPERFSLDEIWTTSWLQLVDIITGDRGHLGNTWWWWKAKPHLWNSFQAFFLSTSNISEPYRRIFQILYGSNKRLVVGIADLVYLPFSDNQLQTFISIMHQFKTFLPSDIFCEMIFSLLIDITMAFSGHWPFENDRYIYNSSVNRLNNLSIIQDMERMNLIKSARDPYSRNKKFRQRPCLFNPDGFIWDNDRNNRQLFETAITNGTIPMKYLLKPYSYRTEFLHPMKLSNSKHWPFQLWHQGMQQQIERFKKYQRDKIALL